MRAEHNKQQLDAMTKRLKDPEKRAEHNKHQLDAMTDRLKDPEKRAEHNSAVVERLRDPDVRAERNSSVAERNPDVRENHNKHVLDKASRPLAFMIPICSNTTSFI